MAAQKYFYKLYITCWSKLDDSWHDIFYGNYKTEDAARKKAKIFIGSDKVKNVNILYEKTNKITILKGVSLWDF